MKKFKKFLCFPILLTLFLSFLSVPIPADEPDTSTLHALSACLMDAETGRVLYEKDGGTIRANASTTKILTCILALEYGNLEDLVTVSKYAASMPDVQLNITAGEQYQLKDLLYSLMLESHNDSAVAIAEHIGGSVSGFAKLMNEKATEIGCTDSHFITPNGLDATETIDGTDYIHGTTATDLCRIMAYCIQNEAFLNITRTPSYQFTNFVTDENGNIQSGSRSFSVSNKNAFLTMMDGVLSGKTGFTGQAGYCYVAALKQDDRIYTIALLGCGWPNNKTYKWQDAKLLFTYGLEYFTKKDLYDYDKTLPTLPVENGLLDASLQTGLHADETPSISLTIQEHPLFYLTKEDDVISVDYDLPSTLHAPVEKGDIVGSATYYINDEVVHTFPISVAQCMEAFDFSHCLKSVLRFFLLS